MKKKLFLCLGLGFAALLCIVFAAVFVSYAQPMKAQSFNLSPIDDISEVDVADMSRERGWTIYTQEGDTVTELIYDGIGAYSGLAYPGQPFYFSRVMTEVLDAPSLKFGTANRNFAVFLDGTLIYTDCPEKDNRIGYLTLSTRDVDRSDDLIVSLPEDYLGKTLTIAQSTPEIVETPRMATRALPCSVTVYCDYAYESSLIAESFTTAVYGAGGYLVGLLVLLIYVRQLTLKRLDLGLLCLALSVFLLMSSGMYNTSYYLMYFGIPTFISASQLCRICMSIALLAFLSTRGKRLRWLSWTLTGVTAAGFLLYIVFSAIPSLGWFPDHNYFWHGAYFLLLVSLICVLMLGVTCWRRESRFYRPFIPAWGCAALLYLILRLALPSRRQFLTACLASLQSLTLSWFCDQLVPLALLVSLVIVIVQFFRDEINRYAEKRLVLQQSQMVQQRYDNLRQHNEEVMMLRHDMMRHFRLLRQTTTDEKTKQYLDELIGQNEKVRPFIQTSNEMLNIILCGRLSAAHDRGIKIDIVRASAPEQLPLSDADLCSLIMNVMDNAVTAAGASGVKQPYIRLDLHMKNNFFVFVCENAVPQSATIDPTEKTVPEHGLGLKIVRQIAEKSSSLVQTECGRDFYKVSLFIPLGQRSR